MARGMKHFDKIPDCGLAFGTPQEFTQKRKEKVETVFLKLDMKGRRYFGYGSCRFMLVQVK